MRACYIALLLTCASGAQSPDLRDALAALARGDFRGAEQALRGDVAARPNDPAALSLLGVALDGQQRFREAESYHKRALAADPRSIDVLGNFGNHLLAAGDEQGAQQAYRKITEIDSANAGANLQLARLALKQKNGAEALRYVQRLPGAALNDPGLAFSLAVGFANIREFDEAEMLFTNALAGNPADFNVLYNLGAVAAAAGHFARAREVLEAALRQRPGNLDVICRLAEADRGLGRNEAALELLARAAKTDPQRADVQKLLATAAGELGALDDALAAWDRYLKLAPGDDVARRERAFTAGRMGRKADGVAGLQRFAGAHPDDPVVYYELGLIQTEEDPGAALAALDKAISLRAGFAAARSLRGLLLYQQGKPEAALADLEMAAKAQPNDAATLDRLGQVLLALDRTADAVRMLRRASELAPTDSTVQLHFGRALAQAGNETEAKQAMERFRQLGPATKHGVPSGFVEYLALTPEQRRADYRSRVEKAVREHPEDPAAQLDYLNLLLDDGKLSEAAATARKLSGLHPAASAELAIANARLLEVMGKPEDALVALAAASSTPEIRWRRTALLMRLGRAEDALRPLEEDADDEAQLLRAVVLQIAGRRAEAERAVDGLVRRRPEWAPVWIARAGMGGAGAEKAAATAAALGSAVPSPVDLGKLLQEKRPAEW
jgi:superkiller protein 3